MNEGQRAHIVERLKAGDTPEQMVQYLQSEGVEETSARASVDEVVASMASSDDASQLPPVTTLLRESWEFTKGRLDLVGWYVLISLVPIALAVVPVLLAVVLDSFAPAWVWVAVVAGVISLGVLLWIMIVASAGLFFAVAQSEPTKFKAGWQWAKSRFWQIAWIAGLMLLVFVPTTIAFLVPAFVVMGYTLFYFLCYMHHDHRGLHALAASTSLVYGRVWAVVVRLAFMVLIIMLLSLGVAIVFEIVASIIPAAAVAILTVGEIVGMAVSFVFTIVMMRYLVLLYSATSALAPAYQTEPLSTSYKVYRVLAWLGAVFLVSLPVLAVLTTL